MREFEFVVLRVARSHVESGALDRKPTRRRIDTGTMAWTTTKDTRFGA